MALKTGLHYIVNSFSHLSGVVTADADGQHRPKDILAIGEKIGKEKNEFLVGSRDFSLPQVPWKSRWGNRITSFIFKWVTGTTCHDTQTGLRGIPMDLIPLALGVNGARYEYEMNVLLQFGHHHIFIREIPIETVYFGSNENSHFNSWRDSFRIYSNFIKIILSHSLPSILFGIADFATFLLLIFWFNSFDLGPIMLATFLSRTLTKLGTIGVTRPWTKKKANFSNIVLILSVLLFILEMVLSGLLVYFLTLALPALLVAKLLADIFLYGFVNLLKGVFVRLILRKKR